jgi:fibronectin-binding autotransporter adhesin
LQSSITSVNNTVTDNSASAAISINNLTSALNVSGSTLQSNITSVNNTVTNNSASAATSIRNLTSALNVSGSIMSASVSTVASTTAEISGSVVNLKSQYVLEVTSGNRVAGFKVASGEGVASSFTVQADLFKIVNTQGQQGSLIVPFQVDGTGVYMDSAYIRNLDANKINAGTINAALTINSPTISGGTITGGTLNIGSGTFRVDSNGRMTASAAQITGEITSTTGNIGGFTLGSTSIRNNKTTLTDSNTGVYLGTDGVALGANSAFIIKTNGQITASAAKITGDITANVGSIGGWTITPTKLTGGNITLDSSGNITASNAFFVSHVGHVTASAAKITGDITANKGSIGGWSVGATTITGGALTLNSNGSITGSTNFKVSPTGILEASSANITGTITANNGTIGGWNISPTTITGGTLTLNSNGTITGSGNFTLSPAGILQANSATLTSANVSGTITANDGTIGGWNISPTKISSGTLILSSSGVISGGSISGTTITGTTISGNTISGGSISGTTITGGSISGTTITGTTISGNTISGGSISGTTITGTTISGNTISGGSISGTTITGGSINIGSGKFIVAADTGDMTSIAGTIAGWSISANTLTGGNSTLNSNGTITVSNGGIARMEVVNNRARFAVQNSSGTYTGIFQGDDGIIGSNLGFLSLQNNSGTTVMLTSAGIGTFYTRVTAPFISFGDSTVATNMAISNNFGYNNCLTFAGGSGDGGKAHRWVNNGNTSELAYLTTAGQLGAGSFNATSSKKYKTNIVPISNAMSIVNKLQGVYFDWKDNKKVGKDIGFIAEDVNEVLPSVVLKLNNQVEAMEYGKLTAILVEAIKELSSEVQELKRQINELRK